jgi:alanine racemase
MSLTLTVDGERWRRHLAQVADQTPGLVPVAKGNGYGFTIGRLARKTEWLAGRGLEQPTLAVGTYAELDQAASRFSGSLLVLTPWRPGCPSAQDQATLNAVLAKRVIHTVSRVSDLAQLLDTDPHARFVLEQVTSMLRHGMSADELRDAGRLVGQRHAARGLEGVAVHLPLSRGAHLPEMHRLMNDTAAAELDTRTVWVSHLSAEELQQLRSSYADVDFRPRVGTSLWLGDRQALRVTSKVLDVHEVARGERFGYRGRPAARRGHIVVVSGGTSHGIGLVAPTGNPSMRARASALARGGLDAVGVTRSPFLVGGTLRVFAEPPHMQASMLFLPAGSAVPQIGDEVEARVRFTTTTFDRIVLA